MGRERVIVGEGRSGGNKSAVTVTRGIFISSRYVESGDQTDILREGYWASYNVPFYEDIYYRSGYAAAEEKTGTNVYQLGPRPKIFRRDQSNVC